MEKAKTFWVKTKRKIFPYQSIVKVILLTLLVGIIFFLLVRIFPRLIKVIQKTFIGPRLIYSLLTADTSSLTSSGNRVNLLILGAGSESQQGIDLTDTLIFVSIDKGSADTVMLSLPRDLWLESLKTKINAVYYYGEEKEKGGGFALAKDAVYQILNQPVHYSVLIDFEGFVNLIDLLGGLDIKVDRSFDDYKYPIAGRERDECNGDPEYKCRWEHLHFEAGQQHMEGKIALKFVRSRNAQGEEGTDFSRSQRQQKVIMNLAQKIFSYQTLFNPAKIMELKENFGDHVKFDTQFNENQITAFLSLFLRFVNGKKELRTISLDYGDPDNPGFLVNPPEKDYGQWVLIPRAKDWSEIQKYVADKIYKGY